MGKAKFQPNNVGDLRQSSVLMGISIGPHYHDPAYEQGDELLSILVLVEEHGFSKRRLAVLADTVNAYNLVTLYAEKYPVCSDIESIVALAKKVFDPDNNAAIEIKSEEEIPVLTVEEAEKIVNARYSFLEQDQSAKEDKLAQLHMAERIAIQKAAALARHEAKAEGDEWLAALEHLKEKLMKEKNSEAKSALLALNEGAVTLIDDFKEKARGKWLFKRWDEIKLEYQDDFSKWMSEFGKLYVPGKLRKNELRSTNKITAKEKDRLVKFSGAVDQTVCFRFKAMQEKDISKNLDARTIKPILREYVFEELAVQMVIAMNDELYCQYAIYPGDEPAASQWAFNNLIEPKYSMEYRKIKPGNFYPSGILLEKSHPEEKVESAAKQPVDGKAMMFDAPRLFNTAEAKVARLEQRRSSINETVLKIERKMNDCRHLTVALSSFFNGRLGVFQDQLKRAEADMKQFYNKQDGFQSNQNMEATQKLLEDMYRELAQLMSQNVNVNVNVNSSAQSGFSPSMDGPKM